MKRYYYNQGKKELHVQNGFEWGNDLTICEDGVWGTYCPMTDEEHRARGYKEIPAARAAELAEIAGYELEEE